MEEAQEAQEGSGPPLWLGAAGLFMGGAPWWPEPHLLQKLQMWQAGTLSEGMDWFDVVFHSAWLMMGVAVLGLVVRRRASSG